MPVGSTHSHLWMLCFVAASTFAGPIAAGADQPLKVGLLCAGSVTDGGWNQLAKEGIETLKTQLGAQISILQKVTADKAGDDLRAYAAQGYDLVICHGYEFLNPAANIAKSAAAASATHYAVSGADVAKPGLVTLDFDLSQASYQVGLLAAHLSKSGKLGFIGGSPIPSVKACYRGFLAGARSVKADISVVETYTSWDQPEQSKAQAEALMSQGVDGIYHDVDAASRGIFESIAEHDAALATGTAPVYVYGSVADQNATPTCAQWIPASAVIHLDRAFIAVAKSIRAGQFTAGVVHEDLASGTCVIVLNPAFVHSGTITAVLAKQIDDVGARLVAKAIVIPSAP